MFGRSDRVKIDRKAFFSDGDTKNFITQSFLIGIGSLDHLKFGGRTDKSNGVHCGQ
mgnify:CR=1 FL=1